MGGDDVTVKALVEGLRRRQQRLPFEIGAFVALEASERLLERPLHVTDDDVRVSAEGAVRVTPVDETPVAPADAAEALRVVLARLLVAAGSGVPPTLLALIDDAAGARRLDLPAFRDELEASLVPLNRSAARRVLSRMVREIAPGAAAPPRPAPAPWRDPPRDDDGDGALDALFDDDADAPAPRPWIPSQQRTLVGTGPTPGAPAPDDAAAPPRPPRPSPPPPAAPGGAAAERVQTYRPPAPGPGGLPSSRPPGRDSGPRGVVADRLDDAPPRRPGVPLGLLWGGVFVALAVSLVALVAVVRPDAFARLRGGDGAGADSAPAAPAAPGAAARRGDLVVEIVPPRAQVFLLVGRGPAVAGDLPVGVAQEFLAVADGRAPGRAVVPPAAEWPDEGDGPRYELAIQAGPQTPGGTADVGESGLPRDPGRPGSTLGSVRVVTNPPGAKVYQLVGFAPEVRIRDLPVDDTHELLVARDGWRPRRVVVEPSRWEPLGDGLTARVAVTLERDAGGGADGATPPSR